MESIVFDNAGTILRRVTALKDMTNNKIIFETNTIGIANQKTNRIIVVLQTPTKKLLQYDGRLVDFLEKFPNEFEISYSQKDITKDDVLNTISNDPASINDIEITAKSLIDNYSIEICSGSALIIDMDKNKIDYVYTAGGLFFEDTKKVMDYLRKLPVNIYIASGDNKQSLLKIASTLNIPTTNVFDTLDRKGKEYLIKRLQNNGNHVLMVGNNANDELAIKQADIGILTLEQGEILPDSLLNVADYKIKSIGELIKILKKDKIFK